MQENDGQRHNEYSNRKRRRFWLWVIGALAAFLICIGLFVPTFDVDKRQRGNEAATVSRLLRLKGLQDGYAASFPTKGFACQLSELKPATSGDGKYDPNEFLLTGTQSGYKFTIANCRPGPAGIVMQYEVAAVPIAQGRTGFRAFCADQTGVIWYDSSGSAEHCLASRRGLE